MIKFIYGPAGSGKSDRVARLISNDISGGKKVFLIVPEQEAVAAERRTVALLGASAQLNFEVLNFSRLANLVFRKYGGLSYNYINDGTKALIMWEAVKELSPLLTEYTAKSGEEKAVAELLLSAIGELKTYSVTPGKLEAAAKKLPDDSSLKKKLSDVSLVYSVYDALLHERYEDASEDLSKLSSILGENDFFAGSNVYIDSYSSYTPEEYSIIFKIFEQADNTVITLGCDTSNGTLVHFDSLYDTSKRLKSGAELRSFAYEEEFLSENLRSSTAELKKLERDLWKMDCAPYEDEPESISIIEASTPFAACEAVAADIIDKVSGGALYRDIAIIGRSSHDLEGTVDAILEKHGIPYYISKRTDIESFALIKLIYNAFSIKKGNWRLVDVISYMRTGLCGISLEESDIFEEYASTWNICGSRYVDGYAWNMNPDGFVPELTERSKLILASVNETKKKLTEPLCRFFARINVSAPIHSYNVALYEFLRELDVFDVLSKKAESLDKKGQKREASELVRLWNVVMDTLDDIDSALPDAIVDASDYLDILHIMFERTDIGSIPTTTDEITVGGADMLRADRVKHVYVFGLVDGMFPRPVGDNGIFSDADKKKLESLGIELSPGKDLNSSEELYYCYRAMCAPRDTLTLVHWVSTPDKKSVRPSIAVERVKTLFPKLKTRKYDAIEAVPFIASKEGALEYMFATDDQAVKLAIGEIFENDDEIAHLMNAHNTPVSESECKVSKELAKRIFGSNMRLSQSRVDRFVECPFSYYSDYVLRLRENKRAEFRYNDLGTFVHEILERYMRETRKDDGSFNTELSDAEIAKIADELISDYIDKLSSDNNVFTNRLRNLFIRLRRTIILLIKNLCKEFAQSDFAPVLFELEIGKGEGALTPITIELEDKTRVYMAGKVDRVDTYKKDGRVYVRVVDYKTGTKEFSLDDVRRGLNIQMLVYLFTIWKTGDKAFLDRIDCTSDEEIIPAGVLYSSVRPPDMTMKSITSDDEAMIGAEKTLVRNGLLIDDKEILRAMEKDLAGKYIPIKLKKDGEYSAGASVATLEEFGKIYDDLVQTLTEISTRMRAGEADADPIDKSSRTSSCRYCKYKPFCRSSVKC